MFDAREMRGAASVVRSYQCSICPCVRVNGAVAPDNLTKLRSRATNWRALNQGFSRVASADNLWRL